MSAADADSEQVAPAVAAHGGEQARGGVTPTLPPPSLMDRVGARSAASLVLERRGAALPLPRRLDARAELGLLEARATFTTHEGSEAAAQRSAATAFARALAARGTELDVAARHARRALLLGDDATLRDELGTWLAALGEPTQAAATLLPLAKTQQGVEASRSWLRIAVLMGRAGDAAGAARALQSAAEAAPGDPLPHELRGALATWTTEGIERDVAARAYLTAKTHREARGEYSAAFEDLLRAFELAPGSPEVAEPLARVLAERGRSGAADHVLREHAAALGPQGRAVHQRRMAQALAAGDVARALGAALDAQLDALPEPVRPQLSTPAEAAPSEAPSFDELLLRAGLPELSAARWRLAASLHSGEERAQALLELARLADGPLGNPERAVEAWLEAAAELADPAPALEALRHHTARSLDPAPLVEALLRLLQGATAPSSAVVAAARELATLAEQRLSHPSLALWAWQALERWGHAGPELETARARLTPRAAEHAEQWAAIEAELPQLSGAARRSALQRAVGLLRGMPALGERYVELLQALAREEPEAPEWRVQLGRALQREGEPARLERWLTATATEATSPRERERALYELALQLVRRRAHAEALARLAPLLETSSPSVPVVSLIVALAAQVPAPALYAEGWLRLAAPLAPTLRGVLTAVASERLLDAGAAERAHHAAELASRADPSLARPIAALAEAAVALGLPGRAAVLERAVGVIVPRAALCEQLALAHAEQGDTTLALAWTQRWLALRPGEPRAAAALLARVAQSGDPARLADALGWVLSQAQPLSPLLDTITAALTQLAHLDAGRALTLGRRALDVLGPRSPLLREVLLEVSRTTGEPKLGIAVLERWLASGLLDERGRFEILLEVAERRRAAGDPDGGLRALALAARSRFDAAAVSTAVDQAAAPSTPDGELALAEARALSLAALGGAEPLGVARALRELGAARFDLAKDTEAAVAAWEGAANFDEQEGVQHLAQDLRDFLGDAAASSRLAAHAAREPQQQRQARLYAEAAASGLAAGLGQQALRYGLRALSLEPSLTEVLAVIERSATDGELDELEQAYETIGQAALGSFGLRTTHYRAARQFERRGAWDRAFEHALRAFEAVPTEGVSFVLMARLAERSGREGELVRTLTRVAGSAPSAGLKARWLERAASFTGSDVEGARQRVEVLLRALAVSPTAETLRSLGLAIQALLRAAPEDRELMDLRLQHAVQALLRHAEGPDGARLAIEVALVALRTTGRTELTWTALERAVAANADVDEYESLSLSLERLAADREGAAGFIAVVLAAAAPKYANVGQALVELTVTLAEAIGDKSAAAQLLLHASRQRPDDTELAARADHAARHSHDPALMAAVLGRVPPSQQVDTLLSLADHAEQRGEQPEAIAALERALATEGAPEEQRQRVVAALSALLGRLGRREALERLLTSELGRSAAPRAERVRWARALAAFYAARGLPERGLGVLTERHEELGSAPELLLDRVELARQAGDRHARVVALTALLALDGERLDPEQRETRKARLRELAELLDELRDSSAAFTRWEQLGALAPEDPDVLSALERRAEAQGDYEKLTAVLDRRARVAVRVDEVRHLRLRRATVLDQFLGRSDDARAELEALLATTGDHLSVLRVLADLQERLGAPLRAAPLWLRASALARERAEAAELARRACTAYLASGDTDNARRVIDGLEAWGDPVSVLRLRVQLERQSENPTALATALEELAQELPGPERERAELLLEASLASEAGGDLVAARARAERAAQAAPEFAPALLRRQLLDYRLRGAGSADEARLTVAELRGLRAPLELAQAELRTFLIAEALDVALGAGAGQRELEDAPLELRSTPLVAAGLAERLAAQGLDAQALPLFEAALSGELRGLRSRAQLALIAAKVAARLGRRDVAHTYCELCLGDASLQAEARALQLELRTPSTAPRHAPAALPVNPPPDIWGADSLPSPPVAPMRVDPAPSAPPLEPAASPEAPSPEPTPTAAPEGDADSAAPSGPTPSAPPSSSLDLARLERISDPPPSLGASLHSLVPAAPPTTPGRLAPPLSFPAACTEERTLLEELSAGSLHAGQRLAARLSGAPERSQDLVQLWRHLAWLSPGQREPLVELRAAALADGNQPFATAITHVLGVVQASTELVEPPPLMELLEQPEAVRALLQRDLDARALEALSLVWEGAEHVFRKDASTYGVTGLERVPHGAASVVGRAYSGVARLLGSARTPLFQRRSAGPITLGVALLNPPALILSGDPRKETSVLLYHLGAMMAAALPEAVLLYGSAEAQARSILGGLLLAFGPPQAKRAGITSAATLAEILWQSLPARSQRRLRVLCDDTDALAYEAAFAATRLMVRRAGLLAAGDLLVALREACVDEGLPVHLLEEPQGVAQLCASSPGVTDLLRLATSPEYAQARWHTLRPGRPSSGGWAMV